MKVIQNPSGFADTLRNGAKRVADRYGSKQRRTPDPERYGFKQETPPSGTQAAAPTAAAAPTPRRNLNGLVQFARICMFCVAGALIFSNIRPYVGMAQWLGSSAADQPIVEALMQVPVVNGLVLGGGLWLSVIVGFLTWGLLQALQMLPKVVMDDPDALLVLMSWVSVFKGIGLKDSDSPQLRKLKQQFNNLPLQWIERMQFARAIGYVIDAVLCFSYYPPVKGGADRLGVFLLSPSPSDIDWKNVLAAIATMFGLEVIYEVSKILKTGLDVLAQSRAQDKAA